MYDNKQLGRLGENIAGKHIESMGAEIIQRNYSCKTGEIDLIAKEKDIIAFIEVKTRTSDKFGMPSEAVSGWKQQRIIKTALWYLTENNLYDYMSRFDVIEVFINEGKKTYKINYIKDAFQYNGPLGY